VRRLPFRLCAVALDLGCSAFRLECVGPSAIGLGVVRVEADRLAQIGDGPIVIFCAEINQAALAIAVRPMRAEPDGAIQIAQGLVALPRLAVEARSLK
jgi:hypothetical protein